MLKYGKALFEIEEFHNQKAQIFLVGNQTLQSRTKVNGTMQPSHTYYTHTPYKHYGSLIARLNLLFCFGLIMKQNEEVKNED